MNNYELTVWEPSRPISVPPKATPAEMAQLATQLSVRDIKSIAAAFDNESYEMVSTFVWARASASLKKQIAQLGMDFVGEMLGRSDFDEKSDPLVVISDFEALSLAEDLGMMNPTEAMRLKQSLETVSHFSDPEVAITESMMPEEAILLLRSCVANILANPTMRPPIEFAKLRASLEGRTFSNEDSVLQGLLASPYFFMKTTLSVLLSLLKTAKGAQKENVATNCCIFVPAMWPHLRKPERWQVGQSYSDATSDGDRSSASALKRALTSIQGFDYVPETLRSRTYLQAAHKVLEAHFGYSNFHNEPKPTLELAQLGSTIPKPAFPTCMSALLCVRLGNRYGVSNAAQAPANSVLTSLHKRHWEYYLTECLPWDKFILEKLLWSGAPLINWIRLQSEFNFDQIELQDSLARKIANGNGTEVSKAARSLRSRDSSAVASK